MDMFDKITNNLKTQDVLNMKGMFHLNVIEVNTGEIVKSISEKNMIVNTSFDIIAGLLISGDANKKINTIAIGSGGIYDNEVLQPHINDNELQEEVYRKTVSSTETYEVTKKSIMFHFYIEGHEGNGSGGNIVTEAGLFSRDGVSMFSRKTFDTIVKTKDFAIKIDWELVWFPES